MKETMWPYGFLGRYAVPDGWLVHYKEIHEGPRFPTIQEHYANFYEITEWMSTNIRDVEDNMYWDIDGDRMYFGFANAADKTWFIMRWS